MVLWATLSFGQTPIGLIGVNVPYGEDFSGMGSTQTVFLPGWTAINTVNGATNVNHGSNKWQYKYWKCV